MSRDDASLNLLEEALLEALALARSQGQTEVAQSLLAILEGVRARLNTPDES